MGFNFSFFGKQEVRRFNYRPRFYDPEAEARRQKYGDFTKESKDEPYVPGKHVKGSLRDGSYSQTRDMSQNQKVLGAISLLLLFAVIFLVFTGLIFWEYYKAPMGFLPFERWCIAAVYGGGLGNMIDRVRLGYVVDMIETSFMDFPVFNVADIFITCGCILMLLHLFLVNKDFWKEEKK